MAEVKAPESNEYSLSLGSIKLPSTKEAGAKHIERLPNIIIPNDILAKVLYWVDTCPMEISGLGTVEIVKYPQSGNMPDLFDLCVTDVILLDQQGSAAFTEISAEAITKAMYELRNAKGQLKWVWHSHVNMNVFWSGTDFDTITSVGAKGWMIASVFNKRHQHRSAFMQGLPVPIMMDYLTIDCAAPELIIDTTQLKSEYEKKVKTKSYTYTPKGRGYYDDFDWSNWGDYPNGRWFPSQTRNETQNANQQPVSYDYNSKTKKWEPKYEDTPKSSESATSPLAYETISHDVDCIKHGNGFLYFDDKDKGVARYVPTDHGFHELSKSNRRCFYIAR